jgi:hypothetical protein
VTDAGLTRLKALSGLNSLNLERSEITEAGLVHLKELVSVRELWLSGPKITDAGLALGRSASFGVALIGIWP